MKTILIAIAKKLIPIMWSLMIPEIEKWLNSAIEKIGESQKQVITDHIRNEILKNQQNEL